MSRSMVTAIKPIQLLSPQQCPWVLVILLGVLLPVICYCLLPSLGVEVFQENLTLNHFALVLSAIIGCLLYVRYFQIVLTCPEILMFAVLVAWPLIECGNQYLMQLAGINIHFRLFVTLLLVLPACCYFILSSKVLVRVLPYLNMYLVFYACLFAYTLFYNAHAVDPRWAQEGSWSGGGIDTVQATAYLNCLVSMVVCAVAILRHPNVTHLFDRFNRLFLVVTALTSLVAIVGYPFGFLSMMLDGFNRSFGIFTQPNPFAHHLGIVLLYSLGLYCYYQGSRRIRIPTWLIVCSLVLNLLAFLLALSKTAIALLLGCGFLLFALNLSSPAVRRVFVRLVLALLVMVPVGLVLFQIITERSFLELIQARLEQKESMNWRLQIWQDLLGSIDPINTLFGHGFTSANTLVYQMSYNDRKNAQPLMLVHNGYIALFYDMGVLGLTLFISAFMLMGQALKRYWEAAYQQSRPLLTTVIVLTIYFLVACGFDEMTYMFDAPIQFWCLSTILTCVAIREAGVKNS